ncbi:MAG TPA: adenylate kinase [Oscillatoriaceae cyanobacterium M33_DOE_052]|uniref:Adenylate kinase n=1 Tax=Planktothricoides sp. SpSt-374 TaxID=2282167 RepID=A0A7C3ZW21_9CYAN|nr:adenylate kinase [Oscillatoriaceae cyanobacterium M33_DOE_052]
MRRTIFLGPPGAGKGTQAKLLADFCQIPHIATGDLLRAAVANQTKLGKRAQEYMQRGDLVPDNLLLGMVAHRLEEPDAVNGWVLDGFPRNVTQAEFLEELLGQINQPSDWVIDLEVPDETVISRTLKRGRADDNEVTIRHRLEVYREQTAPLIEYYSQRNHLVSINGNRPVEEVAAALKQAIIS